MTEKRNIINRRDFLRASAAGAGALYLSRESLAESCSDAKVELLPKRILGKTGQKLSIIGLGGMVVAGVEQVEADAVVARSVEKGINYFDFSPEYGDSELKLGPALKPFRKDVFLACKTSKRDKEGAEKELHRSLKRLHTDHFDLYQLHNLDDLEDDAKKALSKGGAIQTFIKAREKGLVKYLGFSAHSPEAALLAMREFDFDTILYPINFCCHYKGKFSQEVLSEAKKRGMGILAIKAMAKQLWQSEEDEQKHPKCWYEPIVDPFLAEDALRWTLSQPVTAAIPPGDENLFKLALQIGPHIRPITDEGTEKLKRLAAGLEPIFTM
ncbi:MAG: aldo/keto reductase [Planctomycetota bacterium]|jgi:aryl-alcohol dehydrogenase-like predicted oxidoreductase